MYKKTCDICEKPFESTKEHAKYCSKICKRKRELKWIKEKTIHKHYPELFPDKQKKKLKFFDPKKRKYPYTTNNIKPFYLCFKCGYGIGKGNFMFVFKKYVEISLNEDDNEYIGEGAAYIHPHCLEDFSKEPIYSPEEIEEAKNNYQEYDI